MKHFAFLPFDSCKTLLLASMVTASGFSMTTHGMDIAPAESTAPAELPTVVPNKQETTDSAFAKLDTGKKGYLTLADVKVLSGFDRIFQTTDADHNGKLTPEEFKTGWETYTGIPSSPDTSHGYK